MTASVPPSRSIADEFRREFDAAFAAPPPPPAAPTVALLLVRVGGGLLAVKRDDITGFVRGEQVTPVPGRAAGFLGLAAVRGALVPVWSLGALTGRTPAAAAMPWLVLAEAKRDVPCAFACDAFAGTVLVPASALATGARAAAAPGIASTVMAGDAGSVDVVDLPALLAKLWPKNESP